MCDLTETNITAAVLETFSNTDEGRTKELLSAIVRHLHDLVLEVRATHDEWAAAIDFLRRAGDMSTPERNEFILTSDILGVSSLVDMVNSPPAGGTEGSVLGPFYIPNQETVPIGADLVQGQDGQPLTVKGHVLSTAGGGAIEGAMLEFWQNAENGLYDVQDPDQSGNNLRAQMLTDAEGGFEFRTVRPQPYTVPNDGPAGDILQATGRHPWRPAHLHFRITAKGYYPITTELFAEDDKYLEADAVFGVRSSLSVPFGDTVHYDFRLHPLD